MAAGRNFVNNPQHNIWQNAIERYDDILQEKAKKKSKPQVTKDLLEFDNWYQQKLPRIIEDRKEKHITSEELVRLVKWKLSRGKFRPRLVDFAASNAETEVVKKSKEAFKKGCAGKVKAAIECLSSLKGIGPATASAILAAGCPEHAAFMADEPTVAVLGTFVLKYSLSEYMEYMQGISHCTKQLQEQDADFGWTVHKAELALWTLCQASLLDINISDGKRKSIEHSTSAKKRKT